MSPKESARSVRWNRTRGVVWAISCCVIVGVGIRAVAKTNEALGTPVNLQTVAYRPSEQCLACHADHFQSWSDTFHSRMTQQARPETVLGAFDGTELVYGGTSARFVRDAAGGFAVHLRYPDGSRDQLSITHTVGSHWYQQYLTRENDTLRRLPFAWDVGEARFVHLNGAFLTPDPEGMETAVRNEDYFRHLSTWNDNCVFCHNVAPNPGWQGMPERFDTTTAELGVACGACHGPGDTHIRLNRNPLRRYLLHWTNQADPSIVNPTRLSAHAQSAACGRCHGQRISAHIDEVMAHGDRFIPGEDLRNYSRPLFRETTLNGEQAFTQRFWEDGTPRLTAYEYQGYLMSPCAVDPDFGCQSCHQMHDSDPNMQLRPGVSTDGQCTSCHRELAPQIQAQDHSGHRDVRCVDCHMPRVVYGLVNVHRTHRIQSLSDGSSSATNASPNACTLCHVEGVPSTARTPRRHQDTPAHALFRGDPVRRAVMAFALGRAEVPLNETARRRRLHWLTTSMREDPYPAVRHIASQAARRLDPEVAVAWRDFVATDPPSLRRRWVDAYRRARQISESPPWATKALNDGNGESIYIGE